MHSTVRIKNLKSLIPYLYTDAFCFWLELNIKNSSKICFSTGQQNFLMLDSDYKIKRHSNIFK